MLFNRRFHYKECFSLTAFFYQYCMIAYERKSVIMNLFLIIISCLFVFLSVTKLSVISSRFKCTHSYKNLLIASSETRSELDQIKARCFVHCHCKVTDSSNPRFLVFTLLFRRARALYSFQNMFFHLQNSQLIDALREYASRFSEKTER